MRRWPMLVCLLPGLAVHAAPPVTTTPGVSVVIGRGSSGKPAWEWSDEERIRVRFDPASIRERSAAHAAALPPYAQPHVQPSQAQAQSAEAPRISEHIFDGARDPGLFLPAELLDVLLQGLHPKATFRMHAREALAKDIREMGYTEDDFWNKLQQLSAPYRALTSRPKNLAVHHVKAPDGKMASFLIDVDQCVARHKLLQSARATFGAEAFQRFLYAAVAPQVWRSDTTQSPDPAQELIFVAGGCRQ